MLILKKKSVTGWIIDHMTPWYAVGTHNICQLVRRLLFAIFVFLPWMILSVSFVVGGSLTTILWDILWLFGYAWTLPKEGIVDVPFIWAWNFVLGLIVFVVSVSWSITRYQMRKVSRYANDVVPQPSIIATYLKSLKDKVCVLVKYE